MVAALVFPHQLFTPHPALDGAQCAALCEEPLFFGDEHAGYRMVKIACWHRRAAILWWLSEHPNTHHERFAPEALYRALAHLRAKGATRVQVCDPVDDWLMDRLRAQAHTHALELVILESPMFPPSALTPRLEPQAPFRHDRFYRQVRQHTGVLMDTRGKPLGGRYSFDPDNRQALPREHPLIECWSPPSNAFSEQARTEVARDFLMHPGPLPKALWLPVTRSDALYWLSDFVRHRLPSFGAFEDAMRPDAAVLFHSALSPLLNLGLLTPGEVLRAALDRSDQVPLASLEGFVRQLIGWRTFIREVYVGAGRLQRQRNFFDAHKALPKGFERAQTGRPLDRVLERVQQLGWCHHIERLMVLGNAMLMCECHPDTVYRWFMGAFVDAFDWVMVSNVYGMSQMSDGGMMVTKPYISSAAYLRRMGWGAGPWEAIWNGLFWRFVARHQERLEPFPRFRPMLHALHRMADATLAAHQRHAEAFLTQ